MFRTSGILGALIILFVGFVFVPASSYAMARSRQTSNQENASPFPDNDHTRKIFARAQIESEGDQFVHQGFYDKAIEKYREAIRPEYLNCEYDKSMALSGIVEALQLQGALDQAMIALEEYQRSALPDNNFHRRKKPELEALIKARDTGSSVSIYDYVDHLKKMYKRPYGLDVMAVSDIIRLYDYLGDTSAGISFIDEILAYPKLRDKARQEYLKVKEAFEQDQAEHSKGRATQVLIQSDYFPW